MSGSAICANCAGEHVVCSACGIEVDLTATFTASELKERLETPEVYVIHHHDIEKHAEHFNEGYDEAQRQGIGGSESRGWLTEKVYPLLKDHVDPENVHHLVEHIADALLSENDFSDAEPYSAAELKKRLETATTVALALGRKEGRAEAQGECAAMLEDRASGMAGSGTARLLLGLAQTIRNITRQPFQAASERLTAPTGHSDLPPTPEAARDPHAVVDLVGKLREAVDAARKRRLADLPEGSDQ